MEQETSIAKLIPNRNGSVQYGSVSTHTLGPVHGGEGGGVLVVTILRILPADQH